ncbi:MAG: glycosyltransferase [Flavobacteriales bacterium]|jgi:glycosyltransferase involved in cell wall biosynthesis|nr:glycosyltransferase [Flavobacteriales bacterium]
MNARLEISVVVPVYNAAPFLADAVRSILAQPEVLEVILVEDGSKDASLERCHQLAADHPRIKVLQHPGGGNRGAGASRNLGVAAASCTYIAFLDADDRFVHERFAAERRLLSGIDPPDGVYGAIGVHFHDDEGAARYTEQIGQSLTTMHEALAGPALFNALTGAYGYKGHFSLDGLTIARKALLALPGPFNTRLRLHQDTELMIRLAYHAHLVPGILNEPVALRGVHRNNRITGSGLGAASRSLMYEALHQWALTVKVDRQVKAHFLARWTQHRAEAAQTWSDRWRTFRHVLRHPQVLANFPARQAFVQACFGWSGLLGRLVNKLAMMRYPAGTSER